MIKKHKSKTMKIVKFLTVLIIVLLVGGFGYFSVTDVPVHQQDVSKKIPNERFFDE